MTQAEFFKKTPEKDSPHTRPSEDPERASSPEDSAVFVVESLPQLVVSELDLTSLEGVESGPTYTLDARPPVAFIKELPEFAHGNREVGLFSIGGKWVLTTGDKDSLHLTLPPQLERFEHTKAFALDMHSHPGDDPSIEQPSRNDILQLDSTIDGCNYIINRNGLVEFRLPEYLPNGLKGIADEHKAWTYWITEELALDKDEYERIGAWELKKRFYELFFGLRSIPWEDEDEIERILDKGN